MAIYKSDIVDINLESGSIHRSFMKHSIGTADQAADRFGIRAFRNGEAVDLSGASCYGYFRDPQGNNIALTSSGTVDGNVAYVTLPQACYNYEGNFTLTIKLLVTGVTSTVRIIDGVVDNTNTGSAVAPTSAVPSYSEILSQYDDMVAATAVANGAIATTFNAATVYPAGSYVINSGALYRITADHAANVTWANTSKVATNFGAEVSSLKSALYVEKATVPVDGYEMITSLSTGLKGLYDSSGNLNADNAWTRFYIEVSPNTQYRLAMTAGYNSASYICEFDKSDTFVRSITPVGNAGFITSPTTYKIGFGSKTNQLISASMKQISPIKKITDSVPVIHRNCIYNISGNVYDISFDTEMTGTFEFLEYDFDNSGDLFFRIKGLGWQSGNAKYKRNAYIFFDSTGTVVEYWAGNNNPFDIIRMAPAGSCKLIVNGYINDSLFAAPYIEVAHGSIELMHDLKMYKYDGSVLDMSSFAANSDFFSYKEMMFVPGNNNYLYVSGTDYQSTVTYKHAGYTFLDASGTVLERMAVTDDGFGMIVHAPATACKVIVNGENKASVKDWSYPPVARFASQQELIPKSKWEGKKIVWFGTSIPEGKVGGKSYPMLVAEMLGATVYNESLGSSPMSNVPVNTSPYGAYRALSLTYAEKQAEDWWSNLSDAQKTIAMNSSYDYKFTKYLTGGSVGQVDLYVFDHGYNDYNYLYPDIYMEEPENPNDKNYALGAANFLINSILNDNPRARIVWIGHYEGELNDPTDHNSWGKKTAELQEYIAEKYGIPLCKTWEKTGWGNPQKITTTGYWNGTSWVASGGTSRQDYVKNCMFSDGIHPHTDGSGYSVKLLADIIGAYLKDL